MKIRTHLHWFIYPLFILSCARQSSPTGGPKDTIPPLLVRSNPGKQQLNFKGKTFELTFNEAIQLNNPKEQIIITPSIGKTYDIIVKKNKVIIDLDKPLLDSTTYSFNFRDAIQDITEKNSVRNLKIAISTGTYIDSLSISGVTNELLFQKPVKDVTIAIQPYSDTLNIFKHPALYFTKSNEKGVYSLENLKPAKYFIYAFTDQNKNLIVDSKNEIYGFLKDPIELDTTLSTINISLVKLDTRPLKLSSARPYNTYFNIKTSKNIKDFSITSSEKEYLYYSFGSDLANIQLFNSFPDKDSLLVSLSLTDSIDQKVDTALYAKISKREATPEKFTTTITTSSVLAERGILNTDITFTKPVKEINFDSIYFKIDSINVLHFNKDNIIYKEKQKLLSLHKSFDASLYPKPETDQNGRPVAQKKKTTNKSPEIKNQLYFGRSAFISVEQDSSAKMEQIIQPKRTEDLGTIIAEISPKTSKVIIQLTDLKGKVLREQVHKTQATFDDLNPGDYFLRIILDKNGNGKWESGNFFKKEEPEPIKYYQNEKAVREIKLKANFELGPLLITY
jgi:uncharacterized protein (DUF2141 family)